MVKKGRHRKKKNLSHKRIFVLILFILCIILIYNITHSDEKDISAQSFAVTDVVFETIEKDNYAEVSTYVVYGTHLNVEGDIELDEEYSVENVEVVAKSIAGEETIIDTEYEIEDEILYFTTIEEINTGLDLEALDVIDYYILLKVEFSNDETKYYSLANDTEYEDIEYYTLTRNNSNNKINISFDTLENIPIFTLAITTVDELPDDVYDVVIDPGHGGSDGGASYETYIEAEIVLDVAKELKTSLENIGLKVLLTRDGTESSEDYTPYNVYDEDGRVTIACESNAKILISLHMNSNEVLTDGGLEVYAAPNTDLTFAKLLADNIVTTAGTSYSQMESYLAEEGVYVRIIDLNSPENSVEHASWNSPSYNGIFDTIPYLYVIRETGGIATGAYVDGSDTSYGENIYRNSNVGVEGYLIELGYINVYKDLYNVLWNSDLYVKAITDSLNSFYEIT